MKNLLWVGDAGCQSGFGVATHRILETLCKIYNVTVLGINYRGDPPIDPRTGEYYPYPLYAAAAGGDAFGQGRLIWMCDLVKPDVIVLQNDPWNIPQYVARLQQTREYRDVPIVGVLAVDGKNLWSKYLDGLSMAIFWTKFALNEAREGGYEGVARVIPLGVDLEMYYPIDQLEARGRRLPRQFDDSFIVGNVNRNQPRKRLDLTIRYFAKWLEMYKPEDAYLYLHVAPTGDTGTKIELLAKYYGVLERLLLMQPDTWYGISEEEMRDTYNCFDVQVSTTQGEGFGLTTFEGMACGVIQIVPKWSALEELTEGAVWQVPCSGPPIIGPPYVNVMGNVPDEHTFVLALQRLYVDEVARRTNRQAGLERVHESRFKWSNIGEAYVDALDSVLRGEEVGV